MVINELCYKKCLRFQPYLFQHSEKIMFLNKNLFKLKKCLKPIQVNARSVASHQVLDCKEVSIKVPWGQIAGKWWGPTDLRPVLALHGWQDNCATFDRLIPHLNKNVGFLCIDLPGHGYSSRLPPGMFYHFTNYVILIHYLAKYFQWPKISLMGHSLGGITSYVYSMIYPENVDFVICIDGAKPMIRKNVNIHMANALDKFLKYSEFSNDTREPPSYAIEEIKEKISKPNKNSVLYEYSSILMERNIAPSKLYPGKYYFTRDPRLKTGGLFNFPQDELTEYAQNFVCPIFIAKARGGSYYEAKENFYEVLDVLKRSSKDCDFHYVDGTHHVHLNNPEIIGKLIKQFIQRHNIEDRNFGSIKDDIIVNDNKIPSTHI